MVRDSFAIFILTHGRPDKVLTLTLLEKCNYTGKWYLVIDNEDKTADRYYELYGKEQRGQPECIPILPRLENVYLHPLYGRRKKARRYRLLLQGTPCGDGLLLDSGLRESPRGQGGGLKGALRRFLTREDQQLRQRVLCADHAPGHRHDRDTDLQCRRRHSKRIPALQIERLLGHLLGEGQPQHLGPVRRRRLCLLHSGRERMGEGRGCGQARLHTWKIRE